MILLDTCVVSESLRPNPSSRVLEWVDGLPEYQVYLPSVVIGELQKGVALLPAGKKRTALQLWLVQLRERFKNRILYFDEETAVDWGILTAKLEKSGRKIPVIDSMLAAIALRNAALLATRNLNHYEGTGVEILNPWNTG